MAWMKNNWLVLLLAGFYGAAGFISYETWHSLQVVRAQTLAPGQIFIDSTQTLTACVVKAGFTSYCFAFDGVWVSLNGAPFVQLVASAPPVLSVNGKTGIVVLTGTTTSTTTIQ
jgi:hypothetical protein